MHLGQIGQRKRTGAGFRRVTGALSAAALLALPAGEAKPASATVAERLSPPGQIYLVTLNARQHRILSPVRSFRLFRTADTLRARPKAFDGGASGAVATPDVLALQEMRPANLEVLGRALNRRYNTHYEAAGTEQPAVVRFLINTDTVALDAVGRWPDACINGADGKPRIYQFVRLRELATGLPFIVASVHLHPKYPAPGCRWNNIVQMRALFEAEAAPVVIAGDFNERAVDKQHDCDPNETSPPRPWWSLLTSPDHGRAYQDAVFAHHRRRGLSLAPEWTHEQKRKRRICDGSRRIKRNRIDYVFASGATVAEAHTDHPGWAGKRAGQTHPRNFKYSDHRFVSARLVLVGPPRPPRPRARPQAGGAISLDWTSVEGATELIVYRAKGWRSYEALARLDASVTEFVDHQTDHGASYRYALAGVGPVGGQGPESRPGWGRADARGPLVKRTVPRPGSKAVEHRPTIRVRFNEAVAPDSIGRNTVSLYHRGRRVPARLRVRSATLTTLDPHAPLRRDRRYWVVVRPVADRLGNLGDRHALWFRTRR